MSDIQHLIEMLKSDNPNKRYDACEELRVAQHPLPQDAMDALHTATDDSNPEVADAAQRAIALHTPQSTDVVVGEKEQDKVIAVKYWSLIGLLAGIAPALVFAVIAREWIFGLGGAFCFGSLGIPFTLVGAYIGRRSNKSAWIGAVLGMALGIGFLIALLSTCFFCQ